jgi:Fic family protein
MYLDIRLGRRIQSKKKELDRLRPFPALALRRLRERFNILLSYNSNAIEGNTLSLGETKLLIEHGITIGGKSMREHLEAVNHKKALDFIEDTVRRRSPLDINFLCHLHGLILDGIADEEVGAFRRRPVHVEGASFVPARPDRISELMKDFFTWLNNNKGDVVETAALAHERFTLIHPFVDGNGRIARILTSVILMRKGYPPVIILKTERKRYIGTLDMAHQKKFKPFVDFIGRCVERSLNIYLEALKVPKENEEYVPLSELAEASPLSQEYLSLLARKGRIDAQKLGRNWLSTKKAVQEYMRTKRPYRKGAQ